jgi:hypothetical protein
MLSSNDVSELSNHGPVVKSLKDELSNLPQVM